MPIYIYTCKKCEQDFEYLQKISDPPMTTCDECGGSLKKKITAAAFHLKGGGWYKDLYASSKPDSGDSGTTESKDKGASSGEGKAKGSDASKSASTDSKSSSTEKKSSDSSKSSISKAKA